MYVELQKQVHDDGPFIIMFQHTEPGRRRG